jgi:outer membrane protein assembly factor BamB
MRALLALALLVILVPVVRAQPDTPALLWQHQGIEDVNAFAWLPDVDGDLVPDVVIETYDAGADGDHLLLVSGGASGTPAVIWSVRPSSGASNGGGYGQECLVACDDLSGDGLGDVLLGTAWGNRSVHAVDGVTGDVLWTFDSYDEPESGWVYCVRAMPDRTGDGRPEVVFGTGSEGHRGYLLDGADGSIIWRFIGSVDAIGHTEVARDLNDDGIADIVFCGWDNEHRVFCVSGAGQVAGATLWTRNTGASNHNATVIDDVTGDGVAEVVVGTWDATDQVICLDGTDGSTVWTYHNGSYNYIMRLVTVDDVDGDGVRDIAVGSWWRGLPVVSGATGDLIWISYAGTENGGDFWTVAAAEDVDGDGVGEVVGGSFDGNVYLFSGADGDTLWAYDTFNRLYSVAGLPDLSGDGSGDVMGGTQYLSGGGRAYALEGGADVTAVPELPAASGIAVRNGSSVELSWEMSEAWPCVVDRIEAGDAAKAQADRRALAEAFARGDITTREAMEAVRANKTAGGRVTRITIEPIAPSGQVGGGWSYAAVDPQAAAGAHHRVAMVLPNGREITLLELHPTARGALPPVLEGIHVAPNPFNPRCELRFDLARPAEITVDVLDVRGRLLGRIGPVPRPAGPAAITWDGEGFGGRELAAGTYVLRARADGRAWTVKAALVR